MKNGAATVEPDELGVSELDDALAASEADETDDDQPSAEDDKPEKPETDDETSENEGDDPEKAEKAEEPEKSEDEPGEKAEEGDDDPQQKALKDTQRAFHQAREELKQQRLENERLKAEMKKHELQQKANGFKKLDDEELDDLFLTDRKAYDDYRKQEAEHEQSQQALQNVDADTAKRTGWLNLVEAVAELNGVDVNNISDPFTANGLPQELTQFFSSPEFVALDKYLSDNMKPDANGVYTKKQIMDAHKLTNFDTHLAKAQTNGRTEAVASIKAAANGGSKLDKTSKTTGPTKSRSAKDYSSREIEELGVSELKQLAEEGDE